MPKGLISEIRFFLSSNEKDCEIRISLYSTGKKIKIVNTETRKKTDALAFILLVF